MRAHQAHQNNDTIMVLYRDERGLRIQLLLEHFNGDLMPRIYCAHVCVVRVCVCVCVYQY